MLPSCLRAGRFACVMGAVVAAACSVEAPIVPSASSPSQAIAALVEFEAPVGWTVEAHANGGGVDPVVAFVDGLDRIAVYGYGSAGSAFKIPAEFLSGAAATTMGREPERIGSLTVAGLDVVLYAHGVPILLGDPHAPSALPTLGREVYCVLPIADGRFVVLAYARESPAPDVERRGEVAWERFLRTVRVAGRKT